MNSVVKGKIDYDDSILSLTTNNNKKICGPKAEHYADSTNNPHDALLARRLGPSPSEAQALFHITSVANNKIAKQIQINRSTKDDARTFSTDSYNREENIEERDPSDEKISEQHDLSRAPHNDEITISTCWSRSSLMAVSSSNYDGTCTSEEHFKQRQQASFVVNPNPRYLDPYPSSSRHLRLRYGEKTDGGTSACSTGFRLSRAEKLYNLSKDKQEEGKKRRDAIALASYRRNYIPDAEDFGFLPLARASDMYDKGMRVLREKKGWIVNEQEKRRANMKGESELQYDNYKQRNASTSPPDLLIQRQFVSPQTSKKLSSSRLNDMYKRSLLFIHKKHVRIEALHTSLGQDLRSNPPQKKIPMSRANNMYKKSLRSLFERNKRIAQQHAANMERNGVSFSLKLPASRSVNMYERSIKYIGAKNQRIHQAKKAKQQEIENMRKDLGRMCMSRASHAYLKGMKYLHAKEKKLARARQDEEEDVSQQHKMKATSPSFDTRTTTMYTKRATRESIRADAVKQVVDDYLIKKKIWLRPSTALFLAEHLTKGPIDKAIPANISTTNYGFLETSDVYPAQGKEEKSIDTSMTANNATLAVGGRVGSPLGTHENKENLIRLKCERLAMCPL